MSADKPEITSPQISETPANDSAAEWLFWLGVFILEVYFFRSIIFTNASFGIGPDSQLNFYFCEHWYRLFCGLIPWSQVADLGIFYPYNHTLSYSDLMLVPALPYSLLRCLGCDIFAAGTWSIILLHMAGTAIFLVVLRRQLHLGYTASLSAVLIASLAANYGQQFSDDHLQMISLSLLPFWAWAVLHWLAAWPTKKLPESSSLLTKRLSWGALVLLTGAAIFYSGFYTGYFLVLYLLVSGLVFVVLAFRQLKVQQLLGFVKSHGGELVIYLVGALLLIAPLLGLYLPHAQETGAMNWDNIKDYLPNFSELFIVPEQHWLYGAAVRNWQAAHPERLSFRLVGFPALTLGIFTLLTLRLLLNNRAAAHLTSSSSLSLAPSSTNQDDQVGASDPTAKSALDNPSSSTADETNHTEAARYQITRWVITAGALACLLLIILEIRWNDYSLWWLISRYLPGGGAIRAVNRLNVFLLWPMALIIALACQELLQRAVTPGPLFFAKPLHLTKLPPNSTATAQRPHYVLILSLAVVLLFWADNWNLAGLRADFHPNTYRRFFSTVPAPPADCRLMYLLELPPENGLPREFAVFYKATSQLNAWHIARSFNIKTLNGYSGYEPEGFRLHYPNEWSTPALAEEWCIRNNINREGLYAYNSVTRQWLKHTALLNGERRYHWQHRGILKSGPCFVNPQIDGILLGQQASLSGPYCMLTPGKYQIIVRGSHLESLAIKGAQLQPQSDGSLAPASLALTELTASQVADNHLERRFLLETSQTLIAAFLEISCTKPTNSKEPVVFNSIAFKKLP